MNTTLTADSLNQGLSLSALASVLAGVPPEVALGALAGAVIFVTSAVEYPIKRRLLLSFLSFLCGLLFYKPTASILIGVASLIPTITADSFERGIVFSSGAFVASIVAVRIGIWLYHRSDNPRDLIRGHDDDQS
ncbi:putative holin [Atlantibacter hermannii]|uniref:putative holin n=1 Tax=Atlantibacter hermannii TaxID=565 RepID=UPI0028AA60F3|nr:putative holin [Atlantibacter hermannii]